MLETRNHPSIPETENRRSFSPEASRMIVSAIVPSVIHPENRLKPQQKQQFIQQVSIITQEHLPAKEIAALSGENRKNNHATYEDWSAGVKGWFDNNNATDKQQIQQTFASLGLQVGEHMDQEQINQFFDTYLDMSGSPEEYQRRYATFVQKVVGAFVNDGTLDRQALNWRMTLLQPLLGSFGETDIVALVDAHIQTAGFIAQKKEVKEQQANEIWQTAELPLVSEQSINGFGKLAQKRAVRAETQPQPEDDDDTKLTPELAATDPEQYKNKLFAKLGDLTMYTKKAWELAEEKDWVSKDELTLVSTTWDSHSDAQRGIQLGTAVLPENIPNPIFLSEQFSYEDEIAFRLTHELVHKVDLTVLANDQAFQNLSSIITQLRTRDPEKGLTVLGHHEHYREQGPEVQAREDLVELAAMYLYDASYFDQYLQFLSEAVYEQQRESLQLVTISPGDADAIFAIFDQAIGQQFLGLPSTAPDEVPPQSDDVQKQREIEVLERLLTPELAGGNPEIFKKMLLENLHLYANFGKVAWEYALQHGIVTTEALHINPETWNSSSDSSTGIILGTAQFPLEQNENIMFENKRFSYQEQVVYRLLHELCHKLNYTTFKRDPEFQELMQKTADIREKTGEGFSALGSQFHYERQGPEVQGRDDLVEMVNMYLIDPDYLARFLVFLAKPEGQDLRRSLKLRTIDHPTAQRIFSTIAMAVTKGLSGQLEPAAEAA